jgi:hypothetical protein
MFGIGQKPQDKFGKAVQAEIRRTFPQSRPKYNRQEFEVVLALDGARHGYALHRLYLTYQESPKADRPAEIRKIARVIAEPPDIPDAIEDAKPGLLPRLLGPYDADFLAHNGGKPLVTMPLSDTLMTALVWDTPDAILYPDTDHLAKWNLAQEDAFEIARYNLRRISQKEFEEHSPGVFVGGFEDFHDATRMCLPELFHRLPVEGAPVATAANRTAISVTGDRDMDGLTMLAALTVKCYDPGRPLYPGPLILKEDGWRVFETDEIPQIATPFGRLIRHYWADMFNEQRSYLTEMLEEEGDSTYVASASVFTHENRPQGALNAAWTEGIDILLPEVEFVAFTSDDIVAREELVLVPLSLVKAELGDLLEPTDYRPARYRVSTFPSARVIADLFDRSPKWWLD